MVSESKIKYLKSKLKQHPTIDFVYYFGNKLVCMHHLNGNLMNHGSMKQHVEGKAHKIDFKTGKSISTSGLPQDILELLEIKKQEQKDKLKKDDFNELKSQLEYLIPEQPEDVKELLAKHAFDGQLRFDIQDKMDDHKRAKAAEDYSKLLFYAAKYYPEVFLNHLRIHQETPKNDQIRHEIPSESRVLVPRPASELRNLKNAISS